MTANPRSHMNHVYRAVERLGAQMFPKRYEMLVFGIDVRRKMSGSPIPRSTAIFLNAMDSSTLATILRAVSIDLSKTIHRRVSHISNAVSLALTHSK